MLFIKYVCRVPLRMTEEELLIGDDAIHGEEAYCFSDDVDGLEPTQSTVMRAGERLRQINAPTDYKGQSILEGQPIDGNGNGSSTPPNKEEQDREVKID